MDKSDISRAPETNFYLNLLNLAPFVILAITGLALQVNYHMRGVPYGYQIMGLNRHGWLMLHKLSAVMSLTGITAHCLLHRKYITATTGRIIARRSFSKVLVSYHLFILYALSALTALLSWIFSGPGHGGRSHLVEIHDKLTLLLIILAAAHIISRSGWMWKVGKKILIQRNANSPALNPIGEHEAE
jgi:hypothetical protein